MEFLYAINVKSVTNYLHTVPMCVVYKYTLKTVSCRKDNFFLGNYYIAAAISSSENVRLLKSIKAFVSGNYVQLSKKGRRFNYRFF